MPRATGPSVSSLALRHAVKFSMVMMDAQWRRHAVWWLLLAVLFVMVLGACAVPEHMRVRAGIDPRNQDDQVRFRSTYYFQVFDVCRNPDNGKVNGPPRMDSLYRFRMTGKASSLFSQVHFESGTLHKNEIDPFGANVVFNENLGHYQFVSREKTDTAGCPEGTELERGFQIMGPEGISTFKQDQRLVMAMTSSGKPLISMLKVLSGGMLAAHGSGIESLLPLAQEHIAVLRVKRVIDKLQDDQRMTSEQLIQQVIDVFNHDAFQEAR